MVPLLATLDHLHVEGYLETKMLIFLELLHIIFGISNSLVAELNGAMFAIELAHHRGWNHIWLETDSVLVTLAFKSKKIVPWQLRNRWENCLHLISSMSFFVTHIYRKGNHCADQLTNIGLSLNSGGIIFLNKLELISLEVG